MLFKISQGKEINLPEQLTNGYCYYCVDTHDFWVDHYDNTNTLVRSKLSAEYADKLRYEGANGTIEINPEDIVLLSDGDVVLLSQLDTAMSDTSINAVQNKVIKEALDNVASSANSYTDTKTKDLTSHTDVNNKITTHNDSEEAHSDIRSLLDSHDHEITDVNGLQDALNGKAAKEHGIHVTYSSTAPVMDGTAAVGSSDTVARSDHKHPIDTSRASQADFIILEEAVSKKAEASALTTHINNKTNPHGVTLDQLEISATAAELNIMDGVTATTQEINYVDGVTSNIQDQLDSKQDTITGAASTVTSSDLTASRVLVSNSSGKIAASSTITSTELGYLNNVTSNIQTQLNGKQPTITGAATTITDVDLTASRALISNSSGKVAVSAVTSTELGYLSGVTSNIQNQFDEHVHAGEDITTGTLSSNRLPTVPIAKGGTGATTSSNARTNLDVYSKSEVDSELSNYVPTTRTINSKALSSNITLSASDVGADTSGTASSAVSTHNSSSSAHSSLFDVKADLVDDKVIPTQISSNVVFYNSSFTGWPDDYKAAGKMIIFQRSQETQMQLTSGAYPVGTEIEIVQGNSYPVTILAGSGVTVYSKDGLLSTNGQWSVICLKCISTNTWLVAGDLA